MTETGRNAPCACGSGKRYKHCCGAGATSGNEESPVRADAFPAPDRPDAAITHFVSGNAAMAQRRPDLALPHYRQAVQLKPDFFDAYVQLGRTLVALGKPERAVKRYGEALALRPDAIGAHFGVANALMQLGRAAAAETHLKRVVELRPEHAEAYTNLGNALCAQGKANEAARYLADALRLAPRDVFAHQNLANARMALGDAAAALASYRHASALDPAYAPAHDGLLLALNYDPDATPDAVFDAHAEFGRRCEAKLAPRTPSSGTPEPGRRVRVGYVSSDFYLHSVAHFIWPVLEHHDRARFEVFCYANTTRADAVTAKLQACSEHWRDISTLSDEAASAAIAADGIDILIDLNGHTAFNRLGLFARKPAPIQATWIGYPNTTGLTRIDYRITDAYADPVGVTDAWHSERLIRLPDGFSCYRALEGAPEVSGLPALSRGYVTFCSFNNLAKLNAEVVSAWARILHAVPGARLLLKSVALSETATHDALRDVYAAHGIEPERLDLRGPESSTDQHLRAYGDADIGLDPFPYNGTTTTCEALWMGVPVVTLAGRSHPGRVGVSLLSNVGLPELVNQSIDDYVACAVRLAADLPGLAALRRELRPRMAASPLTDGERFTRHLEAAYAAMHARV